MTEEKVLSPIIEAKSKLRRLILQRRRSLTPEEREKKSAAIAERLLADERLAAANVVLAYASLPDEPITSAVLQHLIADGKTVAVPYITDREKALMDAVRLSSFGDLVNGDYNILTVRSVKQQVIFPTEVDCIIVPGVAFDERCQRLGMGVGFYDRYIAQTRFAHRLAIAFDCQIVTEKFLRENGFSGGFPVEDHDLSVDTIFTESRIINR